MKYFKAKVKAEFMVDIESDSPRSVKADIKSILEAQGAEKVKLDVFDVTLDRETEDQEDLS